MAWLFTRLYGEFQQDDDAAPVAMEGLVLEMLATVSRSSVRVKGKFPVWLQRAKEMVDACFLENLTLHSIAECAGVHTVHLSREFRRHYSSTVGEYIRKRRIEYACKEILSSEVSLAELATTAGFADQSHLTRMFKRHVGMTPTQFRETFRKD